jgi:hypothetical protein
MSLPLSDDQFYIRDVETGGDLVLWWRPDRRGYTSCLEKAGIYSKAEAESIARIRGTDVPYPKHEVDSLARLVVFQDDLPRNQQG